MKMKIGVAAALFVSVAAVSARAQTPPSIQGVWRVTESVVTGANATTNKDPQPSLYIFTKQHYSIMLVRGTAARKDFGTAKDPARLTDAEKMARYEAWDPFTANSGTYSVSGNTVTWQPMVSKSPSVMAGPPITREFEIDGNTLTLVERSPAGQPEFETTVKLIREE